MTPRRAGRGPASPRRARAPDRRHAGLGPPPRRRAHRRRLVGARLADPAAAPEPPPARPAARPGRRQRGPGGPRARPGRRDRRRRAGPRGPPPRPPPLRSRPPGHRAGRGRRPRVPAARPPPLRPDRRGPVRGPSRSVRKPDWLLGEGYRLIRRRLRPGGYVVSNTIHEMPAIVRAMRPFGGRIVSLDVRGHWNRVTVCGRDLPPPRALRRALASRAETSRILGRVALRTR